MKWRPFTFQGTTYDLSHLDPFDWHYTTEATDKLTAIKYKFQVTFSMHCFSRKPLVNEQVTGNMWYPWPREQRIFCFDRYEFSKQLPDIIQDLGGRNCWHTHHGTFFTIEVTTKGVQKTEYEIYFDVTKATRKGNWLNLVIQSAYERTDAYASTRPKKRKIRLHVIARNKQQGREVRPAR